MPAKIPYALSSLRYDAPAHADDSGRREDVFAAIHRLPSRLSQIVLLKYYGQDGRPWTLRKIGRYYGISAERARQLLQSAHLQLRCQLEPPTPS